MDFIEKDTAGGFLHNYFEVQRNKLNRRDVMFAEEEIADSVFVHLPIPKTLDQVKSAREDIEWITSGAQTQDLHDQTTTGLEEAPPRDHQPSPVQSEQRQQEYKNCIEESSNNYPDGHSNSMESVIDFETDVDEDKENSSDSEGRGSLFKTELGAPTDRKATSKENKKMVKEEKREARKTKTSKAVKKRRKKLVKAPMTR